MTGVCQVFSVYLLLLPPSTPILMTIDQGLHLLPLDPH